MQVNYHRAGTGPPLVLIHGIGSRWQVWKPVLDRLTPHRDVVALDLPGFGASPPPPPGTPPGIESLVRLVSEFIEELGLERPHVGGNSLGGWLALELAKRDRVASATALSPGGFARGADAAFLRASLRLTIDMTRRLAPRARGIVRYPLLRQLVLGQMVAHPRRVSPEEAAETVRAAAAAPWFEETLPVVVADNFKPGRAAAGPGDGRLGRAGLPASALAGTSRRPSPAWGPRVHAAGVRAPQPVRRSRTGGAGADRGQYWGVSDRRRMRFALVIAGANLAGGIVVFVFLFFVLPTPSGIQHAGTAKLLNAVAFAAFGLVSFPAVWKWSARRWRDAAGWASAGRTPTESERRLMLRLPLSQQRGPAVVWTAAAIVFAALNAPFSGQVAVNVAITVVIGGEVTCALGYLLAERLLRPLTAQALAEGVPSRPELPGVRARAILTWSLGTGSILIGLALVALGGLRNNGFTLERLSIAVLVLSLIGLVVGLAAMVVLARSLSDRIDALRQAMGLVEHGFFHRNVTVDDASEVGLLQAGFNRMLAGLQEREHLRDLFGRQVGEDVVRLALERGVELGGEARDAAALFVDLEGSTTLAERRGPAEVVELLNRFFAVVVEVVEQHHGWVNKFEGDAALCVFGAPLADQRAAARALAAARELCQRLRAEVPEISAGVGVSAGRVVAGNVGAAKRFEYTVIGDPVNQAARLTELAKDRTERVLASEEALARAGEEESEHWRVCGELPLRGRARPTRVAVPRT